MSDARHPYARRTPVVEEPWTVRHPARHARGGSRDADALAGAVPDELRDGNARYIQ